MTAAPPAPVETPKPEPVKPAPVVQKATPKPVEKPVEKPVLKPVEKPEVKKESKPSRTSMENNDSEALPSVIS